MSINFQRILIVSSFNFLLKKVFRHCEYFVEYNNILDHSVLYTCLNCNTAFSSKFVFTNNKVQCPCCLNTNLDEHNNYQIQSEDT